MNKHKIVYKTEHRNHSTKVSILYCGKFSISLPKPLCRSTLPVSWVGWTVAGVLGTSLKKMGLWSVLSSSVKRRSCHRGCSWHVSWSIGLRRIKVFQMVKWRGSTSIDTQLAMFSTMSSWKYLEKIVFDLGVWYETYFWCSEPAVWNLPILPQKCKLNASSYVFGGRIGSFNARTVLFSNNSNLVFHRVSSKLVLCDWKLTLLICIKLLSLVLKYVSHING